MEESLSFGVLGEHGRGVTEHFGIKVSPQLPWAKMVFNTRKIWEEKVNIYLWCVAIALQPIKDLWEL